LADPPAEYSITTNIESIFDKVYSLGHMTVLWIF